MRLRQFLRRVRWAGAFACPFALSVALRCPRRLRPLFSELVRAGLAHGVAKLEPLALPHGWGDDRDLVLPGSLFPGRHLEDYAWLGRLAQQAGARRIFEIGTGGGAGTLVLALSCPEATVCTLALPGASAEALALRQFQGRPEAERIVELFGDSREFDFAPYEADMDVVYVDGGHDWATVESDTESALRMAKPGALILWHDYGRRGCDVSDYLEALNRRLGGEVRWAPGTTLAVYHVPRGK